MTAALLTLLLAITPAEMGSLRIVSQPGVGVTWEDVEVGQTDSHGILLIEQIPVGQFSVKLQKPGHVTVTRIVAITATEARLAVQLKEIPRVRKNEPRAEPPPAPATATPAPAGREAAPPAAPAPRLPEPPRQEVRPPDPARLATPAPATEEPLAGPTEAAFEQAGGGSVEARSDSAPALVFALIAAVLLAASVLLIQARRSRAAVEYRVPRRRRSRHEGLPSDHDAGEAQGGVDFIDHLKKREMDLEKFETEGGVVEVEVTEIRTVEEDG